MEYKKRCQWCGVPFIAHKLTTLYCCKACWDKAYEAKRRQNKREAQRLEVESARPVVESIGTKEFLNPTEAARLLGVSRASMYRYMEQGGIKVLRTPARTIVRRSDIEALFDNPPAYIKRNNNKLNMLGETYSMLDITKKYNISKRVAESRIRKFDILKIMRGRNIFYRREDIHKYFEDFTIELDTDFYYNAEEIMEKYNMTHQAIVAFARRHEIPRIYRNRVTYYSKAHIDSVKTTGKRLDPNYYTRQEIMSRYHFTKEQVSYYLNTYHIERKQREGITYILSKDIYKHRRANKEDADVWLAKGGTWSDGTISVWALGSTDSGVSWIVETEGQRIFHAGDLNNWYARFLPEAVPGETIYSEEFDEEIDPIAHEKQYLGELKDIRKITDSFDVVLFPIDGRIGNGYTLGGRQFIERFKVGLFVPMHFVASGFESSWRMKEFTDEKGIPYWEISKEGDTIELKE